MNIDEYIKMDTFYEEVQDTSIQPLRGDIIIPFKSASSKISRRVGVIIITNECDILNGNAKYIVFLPIYKVIDNIKKNLNKNEYNKWFRIISLNHKNLFFLPPHPLIDEFIGGVINFQDIHTLDINYFNEMNPKPTIRLKSPYIDRLCSKVAGLFNRIPINHPEDDEIQRWLKEKIEQGE